MKQTISFEGCKNVGLRLKAHQTCIYAKKINILMPKVHKICTCSKKTKILIVKSHQTCIYSNKSKRGEKIRLYVGLTGIDELVFVSFVFLFYVGLVTFPYQFFVFLSILSIWKNICMSLYVYKKYTYFTRWN